MLVKDVSFFNIAAQGLKMLIMRYSGKTVCFSNEKVTYSSETVH